MAELGMWTTTDPISTSANVPRIGVVMRLQEVTFSAGWNQSTSMICLSGLGNEDVDRGAAVLSVIKHSTKDSLEFNSVPVRVVF